jgi:hypothetical protein
MKIRDVLDFRPYFSGLNIEEGDARCEPSLRTLIKRYYADGLNLDEHDPDENRRLIDLVEDYIIALEQKFEPLPYEFQIPIGDWSDDGHGKCDYFLVRSNLPLEEVERIAQKAKDVLGFALKEICEDYEVSSLSQHIVEKLEAAGFELDKERGHYSEFYDECYSMDPESCCDLILDLLSFVYPKFVHERMKEPKTFYGASHAGYGCYF